MLSILRNLLPADVWSSSYFTGLCHIKLVLLKHFSSVMPHCDRTAVITTNNTGIKFDTVSSIIASKVVLATSVL